MTQLTLLSAGYCTAPEHAVLQNGRWGAMRLPALFALLVHPREGVVLFDTGYSSRFFTETARFPYSLYARVTPVYLAAHESAVAQLARYGIAAAEVRQIIISHFHADHIGALRDFPQARFRFFAEGYAAVQGRSGVDALRRAYLPGLLPDDFAQRAAPLDISDLRPMSDAAPFRAGVDLFGDGSAIAVRLPGHAVGQLGVLVTEQDGQRTLLSADSCWSRLAITEHRTPFPLLYLINSNLPRYHATLRRLRRFAAKWPDVRIIPSHCIEAERRWAERP